MTWASARRIVRQSGRRADQLYEELRRDWLRRHRRLFLVVNLIVTTIVVGSLVMTVYTDQRWVVWVAGVFAGLAIAFAVIVRLSPPAWIESYQVGAIGERRTGAVLGKLPAEHWTVLSDLHHRSNGFVINFDHIAIGPPGVFLIDTKNLDGSVEIRGDKLGLTRPGSTRAVVSDGYAGKLRAQCRDVNTLLRERTALSPWVTGVVAIWADFPQRTVAGEKVHFVHGDHLADWLTAQPERLTAGKIQQLADALRPGRRRA